MPIDEQAVNEQWPLVALREAAAELSVVSLNEVGGGSRTDLAVRLGALTALMATLDQWKGVLEMRLGKAMPKSQEITPVGMLKREPKYSESWDNKGCQASGIQALATDFATDRATGEVNEGLRASFQRFGERLTATFSVGKPKFTALRALGVEPEHYRTRETAGWKVTLVPLEPMADAVAARTERSDFPQFDQTERRGSDGE